MLSRHFYNQTLDGCLERKEREQYTPVAFLPKLLKPNLNGEESKLEMLELDDWQNWNPPTEFLSFSEGLESSGGSRYGDREQGWNGLVEQSIDAEFDQVLIDDAPSDLDKLCISPTAPTIVPKLEAVHKYPSQDRMRRSYYVYPSSSEAEVQALLSIAMPHTTVPNVPIIEEVESDYSLGPEVRMRNKKQKPSTGNEKTKRRVFCPSKKQKNSHNATEKRYRNNLNSKIAALQQTVPSLREPPKGKQGGEDATDSEDDSTYKHRKAVIITQAIEYIGHLEGSAERLSSEAVVLKAQLITFKKQLARLGAIVLGNAASSRAPIAETLETIQEDFVRIKAGNKTMTKTQQATQSGPNKRLRTR